MKNRVYSIRIILIVVMFSLSLSIIFNFINFPHNDIVYNIGYGVFGSSLVTLFILLIDYQTIKQENYETFFTEYMNFLNCLTLVSFLDVDEEMLLYAKYDTSKNLFWPFDFDDTMKREWFSNIRSLLGEDDKNTIILTASDDELEGVLNKEADKLKSRLYKTLSSYLSVSKFNHSNLDRAYVNIHTFFWPNKNRHHLYYSLYKPAIDIIHEIMKESGHFNSYLEGEGKNTSVIIHLVDELNNKFFKIVKDNNSTKVWAEQYNNLSDELSEFMSKYYGRSLEKQEHQCCYFSTNNARLFLKANKTGGPSKE